MKLLVLGTLLVASELPTQQQPVSFRLDQEAEVGGVAFGERITQIVGFEQRFRKQGKPRLRTQLYARLADTTKLGGIGAPSSYWFREGKFIGVDLSFLPRKFVAKALDQLTKRYGSPQVDAQAKHWYWLGHHSFISLDVSPNGTGSLLIGSVAMLNELVEETPVRAQARQLLGWHPDSIGLPRQMHLRH
jgi:hypothetical protein